MLVSKMFFFPKWTLDLPDIPRSASFRSKVPRLIPGVSGSTRRLRRESGGEAAGLRGEAISGVLGGDASLSWWMEGRRMGEDEALVLPPADVYEPDAIRSHEKNQFLDLFKGKVLYGYLH